MMQKQPWLGKPFVDILFILSPPFLCLLAIMCFPNVFQNNKNMPTAGGLCSYYWLMLRMFTAHYTGPISIAMPFGNLKPILILVPALSFIAGAIIYTLSDGWFWRLLAYLAVYHFVRQQYGFMKLYSRNENLPVWENVIDKFIIYYATIFPLMHWHFGEKRNFNWFVENEFLSFPADGFLKIATAIYWLTIVCYLVKEILHIVRYKNINIPKFAVIAGTLISWYFGIVYFNGDLAFTLLNVISHGIPYMALIWISEKKESAKLKTDNYLRIFFGRYGIIFFLGLIFLLAYLEEGVMGLGGVERTSEHICFFYQIPFHADNALLAFIIPLLALPQITHYIVDGFIWKKSKEY